MSTPNSAQQGSSTQGARLGSHHSSHAGRTAYARKTTPDIWQAKGADPTNRLAAPTTDYGPRQVSAEPATASLSAHVRHQPAPSPRAALDRQRQVLRDVEHDLLDASRTAARAVATMEDFERRHGTRTLT